MFEPNLKRALRQQRLQLFQQFSDNVLPGSAFFRRDLERQNCNAVHTVNWKNGSATTVHEKKIFSKITRKRCEVRRLQVMKPCHGYVLTDDCRPRFSHEENACCDRSRACNSSWQWLISPSPFIISSPIIETFSGSLLKLSGVSLCPCCSTWNFNQKRKCPVRRRPINQSMLRRQGATPVTQTMTLALKTRVHLFSSYCARTSF